MKVGKGGSKWVKEARKWERRAETECRSRRSPDRIYYNVRGVKVGEGWYKWEKAGQSG